MKAAWTRSLVTIGAISVPVLLSAQASAPPPSGDTAILTWAAFECSVFAGMSGKPEKEQERLFTLGYDNGRRFLEAARSGAIAAEDIRQKAPIGITMHASGPSVDFALGRIYEVASNEAYDRIVKRDPSGLPLPVDKWQTDDEVKKIRSETEYRDRNCVLLK